MANQAFGTVFFDEITITYYENEVWGETSFQPSNGLNLHPATHALHYGSSCFEGMKAFKTKSGKIAVYRLDDHVKRLQNSAKGLCLPVPDAAQVKQMIVSLLKKHADQVPDFPGTAYLRPTLIGTDQSIGRAASPSRSAALYILISPVGDYFSLESKMRVLIETQQMRCAPHLGFVKAGGNYASALPLIMDAAEKYEAQQIIFAPNGDVQETAAANCLLINDNTVVTKSVSTEFLPGITRDSVLTIAKDLGYAVEERDIHVNELVDWVQSGEVALSGTAAVLAPVKEIAYQENVITVNQGNFDNTLRLRKVLNEIQNGAAEDKHQWLTYL